LKAIVTVSDEAAQTGCYLAVLLHEAPVALSEPLGDRELIGCMLEEGSPEFPERSRCGEIVQEQ
ncbi:MAG: hypothetical protein ACRDWH_06015, partial [Acidimicrobiia bacterium]